LGSADLDSHGGALALKGVIVFDGAVDGTLGEVGDSSGAVIGPGGGAGGVGHSLASAYRIVAKLHGRIGGIDDVGELRVSVII